MNIFKKYFKRVEQQVEYHTLKADEQKALIRHQINEKWFSISKKHHQRKSLEAQTRVIDYLAQTRANCILLYASMDDEPSTDLLLSKFLEDSSKKLVLTRACTKTKQLDPLLVTSSNDLEVGRFGIRMPKTACPQIDLVDIEAVIVPGRAFDIQKNRLGRGFGFYDRFLTVLPDNVKRIGLAFEFQILNNLPVEEHDMPMDVIITESRVI